MKDCIFCKIIRGDLPMYKIYEDAQTLAFLDIKNDYYGHTLVIPKKHCVNILDADAKTLAAVMRGVQKVSKHYIKLGFDGVNVFINNGAAAQQVVFHLHMHIAPRRAGEGHIWNQTIDRDLSKEQAFLNMLD